MIKYLYTLEYRPSIEGNKSMNTLYKRLMIVVLSTLLSACISDNKTTDNAPKEKDSFPTVCVDGISYFYTAIKGVKINSKTLKPERCGPQQKESIALKKVIVPTPLIKKTEPEKEALVVKHKPAHAEEGAAKPSIEQINAQKEAKARAYKEEREKAYKNWSQSIVKEIRSNLKTPSQEKNAKASVQFIVTQRGLLKESVSTRYCEGTEKFCTSIEKAVIHSQPLPIPPKKYKYTENERTIGFTYKLN